MIKRILRYIALFLVAFFLTWTLTAHCQTTLMPMPRQCFQDVLASGKPLAGGKINTYQAGTSTPQATFTDATGSIANSNPVILDAAGCWTIWLTSGQAYRFVAQNSVGVTEWTTDQVSGLATSTSATSQAITTVTFSGTPTFTATGQYQVFKMTLTGNVTSSTLSMTGVTAPSIISFELTQDGTGGRTFVWPLNVSGGPTLNLTPSAITTASFLWDGTTAFPWNYSQSTNTAVAFSATPTFTTTLQNQLFSMTLTGNVSSSTLNMNAVAAPSIITFELTQDATGGRTFAWPSNVVGSPAVSPIPSSVSVLPFIWDGTNARPISPALASTGTTVFTPNNPQVIFKNTSATVHTGDTSSDTIYSTTLPILSTTSTLRITVDIHATTQGAGGSLGQISIGATSINVLTISGGGADCSINAVLSNQNSVSVQRISFVGNCSTTSTTGAGAAAINTGSAQTLALKLQNANNSDSQTVNQFIVELL